MAVVIEAFTVIVRNSTLDKKYPGGRESFAADCPNQTYCQDGTLSRVAFMHSADVREFTERLTHKGLVLTANGSVVDIAVVSSSHGLCASGCDWLVFATFKGVPIAWADGTTPSPVVGPPGYILGRESLYVSNEVANDDLVYLRSEGALDVYIDKVAGKEVYVSRVFRQQQ